MPHALVTAGPLVVYWLGAQYSNNKFAEYLVAQESVVGYELREVYVAWWHWSGLMDICARTGRCGSE